MEYEKDKFDVWIENKFGKEKAWKLLMILSVAIALILSVAIFMLFPTVITGLLSKVTDSVILDVYKRQSPDNSGTSIGVLKSQTGRL